MSKEKEILLGNIDACKQRIEKLSYSLNKNRPLFPLTTNPCQTRLIANPKVGANVLPANKVTVALGPWLAVRKDIYPARDSNITLDACALNTPANFAAVSPVEDGIVIVWAAPEPTRMISVSFTPVNTVNGSKIVPTALAAVYSPEEGTVKAPFNRTLTELVAATGRCGLIVCLSY